MRVRYSKSYLPRLCRVTATGAGGQKRNYFKVLPQKSVREEWLYEVDFILRENAAGTLEGFGESGGVELKDAEVKIAHQLIEALAADWDPEVAATQR